MSSFCWYLLIVLRSSEMIRFIAPLQSTLSDGVEIEIHGLVLMNAERFTITLQTGYEHPVAAQLRINSKFSPLMPGVQLEYFDEAWNLYNHHDGPLKPMENFKVLIKCLTTHFEIRINDKFYTTVDHQLNYSTATHLSIYGNVTITNVTGVGERLSADEVNPSKAWLSDNLQYQTSPYVPFVANLTETLEPGKTVAIVGSIPSYSTAFAITIQTGSEFEPQKAHLRLLAFFSKDAAYNNITLSYCDGDWKDIQVERPILRAGRDVRVLIRFLSDRFEISIDGLKFANYTYKLDLSEATHLSVLGMLDVTEVVGVKKLPRVAFLDKPVSSPHQVHFEDVEPKPGLKVNIWASIYEDADEFSICLQGNNAWPFYMKLRPQSSVIIWNTFSNGVGKETRFDDVSWLKPGQAFHAEITFLEKSFEVTFYGLWKYTFGSELETGGIEMLDINNEGLKIYAIDGVRPLPSLPPPPPSPKSRVCSGNVLYKLEEEEVWLNNFVCSENGTSPNSAY